MPKQELQEFARKAALESAPANTLGQFIELIEEEPSVYTFLFETKQKGYVGWRWSVTVFEGADGPTVSEVLLMPGEDSLVAPNWIPWSERLADWKALQAELERQAAEEAELAAEGAEDEDASDDEDDDDVSDVDPASVDDSDVSDDDEFESETDGSDDEATDDDEPSDDSAATDLEPGEDAEGDSGKTRSRIPRFIRRRGRRGKSKDKN